LCPAKARTAFPVSTSQILTVVSPSPVMSHLPSSVSSTSAPLPSKACFSFPVATSHTRTTGAPSCFLTSLTLQVTSHLPPLLKPSGLAHASLERSNVRTFFPVAAFHR